jgi:hypothetical protein
MPDCHRCEPISFYYRPNPRTIPVRNLKDAFDGEKFYDVAGRVGYRIAELSTSEGRLGFSRQPAWREFRKEPD